MRTPLVAVLAVLTLAAPATAMAAPTDLALVKARASAARNADLVTAKAGRAPAALRANQRFAVRVTVRNAGRRRAKASAVRLYLSRDTRRDAADVRLLGTLAVKALKPRKAARLRGTVTTPGALTAGTVRLLACADDLDRVRETRDTNNCRAATGTIRVAGQAPVPPTASTPPTAVPAAGGPGTSDPAPAQPTPGGTATPEPTTTPVPTPPPGEDKPPANPNPPTPLDTGAATSMDEATAFLYEGANAPQQGVAAGTIAPRRVAVIRGRVLGPDQKPVKGVRVSVLNHAEYGRTWTDAKGVYNLAVNGAELDLVYEADGYLPLQQQITAPWQDYLAADDVILTKPDPTLTRLDPDSTAPFQVARGSAGGTGNPATLLFPRGVEASLELPDGTTKPSPGMSVRATEFAAGNRETLPGTMPENVGPTYAAEFSLDEAIAAGADSVAFDKPVLNYTDNFLDFPVGGEVPTAYYDRGKGRWTPSANGRVLRIVSVAGGIAAIDADTTPGADTDAALAALGITADERRTLATLYEAGDELWRVPIEHFTPWDHNFPFGLPKDAKPPKLKEFEWKDPNDPCAKQGSIIACESQTLSETLPLQGTNMRLRYDSNRQPGYTAGSRVDVPITGGDLHEKLRGAEATVEVAGRTLTKRWCAQKIIDQQARHCAGLAPLTRNLTWDTGWDGLDAFGRPVQGRPVAKVSVTYVYEFEYKAASNDFDSSFGAFPEEDNAVANGAGYCGNQNPARDQQDIDYAHFYCGILATQTIQRPLGPWNVDQVDGLGGLTLSTHHGYDPNEQVVHRGDGQTIRARPLGDVTRTIVGAGNVRPTETPVDAAKADIDYTTIAAVGPDGSVYGHSSLNQNLIWRMTPDGKVVKIGGAAGSKRGDPSGDGGPATAAVLGNNEVYGMDVGPDGSVYFSTSFDSKEGDVVRRIRPDGIIETVAGVGYSGSPSDNGDGGPAKDAKLGYLRGLDVAPDGSIYLAEMARQVNGYHDLVRRITPDGLMTTVAGGGSDATADDEDLGDGEPALEADLRGVQGVLAAPDGSVYLADSAARVIQRIGTDGVLRRVVGDHSDRVDLGRAGAEAGIGRPVSLAMDREGRLLVRVHRSGSVGSDVKLVAVGPDGRVGPLAGRDTSPPCRYCLSKDGEAAANTLIESNSRGIVALPDGRVLYPDGRYQVRVLEPALPGFGTGTTAIPSTDGAELYVFDRQGRHLETRDALTGVRTQVFGYDAERLATVTDADGNVTRIERDGAGEPVAVVAPGGQRTTLGLDAAGRTTTVADAAGHTTTLGYSASGLLTSFKRPGRPAATMTYDGEGRLKTDTSPTGGTQTLTRTETVDATTVKVTSAEGRTTTYVTQALPDGDRKRVVERPSGAKTVLLTKPDGRKVRTDPDGTVTEFTTEPDPRWGAQVPYTASTVITTPGGRTRETTTTKTVSLDTPGDLLSLDELEVRTEVGDARTTTQTYDADAKTMTTDVSGGQTTTATLDAKGRVAVLDLDGPGADDLSPVASTYDAAGHLRKVTQGTAGWTFDYDARNRMTARTDTKGQVTRFGYDDGDRQTSMTLPSGRTYGYAYEPDGTPKATTAPNGATYATGTDGAGRDTTFGLPGGGAFTRTLDRDGAIAQLALPSGAKVSTGYDGSGRVVTTDHAGAETDTTTYAAGSDDVARLVRTGGGASQSVEYGRDGGLLTATTFGGTAKGAYAYAYDDLLQLTGITLTRDGETRERTLAYDGAGRVTKVGPFTAERDGAGGEVSSLGDGKLAATYAYDGSGRVVEKAVAVGGAGVYRNEVGFGTTGQVQRRVETVAGAKHTFDYAYDADGQLKTVKRDGALVEAYEYDANGNRTKRTAGATTEASTYAADDRQTARGATRYELDADGFLAKRGTDTFTYGRSGALLAATAGGGKAVGYRYDAIGRRVARTTAAGTETYLYGDPGNELRVTAATSPDGVVDEYVYDDTDALVAIQRGSKRFAVGADQVGSPRVVVDDAGKVVKRLDYDAFGTVTDADPGFFLPIGFAGGLQDPVTGLVRFGWRDYDTASGRFTARDPLLFGGSPVNLYGYVNNDPASLRDPSGLVCGGLSFYDVFGGGVQYCRDMDTDKWSFCAEAGVGVGGGVEFDPWGEVQGETFAAFAEVTGKYGPAGVSIGGEVDLNCLNAKVGVKGTVGPFSAGIDTTGEVVRPFGGGGEDDFNGRGERNDDGSLGTKVEGKVGLKKCWAG